MRLEERGNVLLAYRGGSLKKTFGLSKRKEAELFMETLNNLPVTNFKPLQARKRNVYGYKVCETCKVEYPVISKVQMDFRKYCGHKCVIRNNGRRTITDEQKSIIVNNRDKKVREIMFLLAEKGYEIGFNTVQSIRTKAKNKAL